MDKSTADSRSRRVEDVRFVSGTGRYTDDISLAGMTYASFLRSPYAHAGIVAIDASVAAAMPGIVAILDGEDLERDKLGTIPCVSRPRRADGTLQSIIEPPHRALAKDRVRMVGEVVAVVIAETAEQAKDAAAHIEVRYEMLPAIVGLKDAVAPGAPTLWPCAPNNVSFTYELGDEEAVSRAFSVAAHVTDLRIEINRVSASPLEPRTLIGRYDRGLGRFTLFTGHQTPHQMRHVLATRIFNVPEPQIRVVSPDVGGGFGLKSGLFAEDILVLWAARKLDRPVKWTCERNEAFLSDDHARENIVNASLALDASGQFLGIKYEALANLGAFVALRGAHSPTNNLGSLSGPYKTPAIHARVYGVLTNTRPTSSYRGAGRPEATYVLERLIETAALETGIDPFVLRTRNLIAPADMPYGTGFLFTYDSGNFLSAMRSAAEIADYGKFEPRRTKALRSGKFRGIGIANAIEQAGGPVGAPWEERADIRFDLSGSITVLVGSVSNGQGHETVFARIVSDRLGVPVEAVRVVQGDTDIVPFGRGSFGSRSMMAGGSAIALACTKVINKGCQIAAHLLQSDVADVAFAAGVFRTRNKRSSASFADVLKAAFDVNNLPDHLEGGLDQAAIYSPPAPTYPNACHVCELEIDSETGAIDILRYVVVDDVGHVLDHNMVEGQVQGGVAQGLGQCLSERIVYQDNGQIITASFMDYGMPRASDVPACEIVTQGTLTRNNPLGVKGAGEAGTIGALPVVMNAIVNALAPLGIRHVDMPATPERVWHAIQDAKRSGNVAL